MMRPDSFSLHPALAPDRLAHLWCTLEPIMPQVLEAFYGHYRSHPRFGRYLEGHDLERLKQAQTNHWKGVCLEGINEAYFQRCRRIGVAHAKIGLDESSYCTAYGMVIHFVREYLIGDARWRWASLRWRAPRLRALESLYQLVVLDIATCVSAYAGAKEECSWERIRTVCGGLDKATEASVQQVAESTQVIGQAQEGSGQAGAKLSELVEQAQHIYSILKLIRDVAEQTNLLSLNARIEAARAGEAGRGFSVVAEEVKKLSVRVQQATGDIAHQIDIVNTLAAEASRTVQAVQNHMAAVGDKIATVNNVFDGQRSAIAFIQDRQHTQEEPPGTDA